MSGPDKHPADDAPVVRPGGRDPEIVQMRWGFEPGEGGEPIINIRSETADLSRNRCLVPATGFDLFTGAEHPKRRWTVRLKGAPIFFLAAIWREATAKWPESYAVLTIEAAADLAPLTDRQMAVIGRSDAARWFENEQVAADLLGPMPAGSYEVSELA